MAKVCTSISLDAELKKQSIELFDKFGLDLSTAITLFLQQAVREERIPFEIRMNATTKEAIDEYPEMKKDKKLYKRYSSFKDVLKEL